MANMFKVMKSGSLEMQAELSLAGHPNEFQSIPIASKFDWDILQGMHHLTLLCTQCHTGNAAAWQRGIAAIYGDGISDVRSLLLSLERTDRTIHPTSDATVLLMPTQKLIRALLEEHAGRSDAAFLAEMRTYADQFVQYYVRGEGIQLQGYTLDNALTLFESWHVLECVIPLWSPLHLYKCNCVEFMKRASCAHCLLAGAACDRRITVPAIYRGDPVHQRRRRGRPTAKSTELGDDGEVRARDRIALQEQYVMPQVLSVKFNISVSPDHYFLGDRRSLMHK